MIWLFIADALKFKNSFFIMHLTCLSAFLITSLQTLEFFNYFFESARVGQGVYRSILETPRDLLLGMVVPPSEWLPYNYGAEQQVSPFISIPIICFGFAGTVLALRQKDKDSAITILLLGVLPTTLLIFCTFFQI